MGLRVPFLRQGIYAAPSLVVAFECVAVDEPGGLVHAHAATAFPAESATSILGRHQLLGEGALLKIKIERIETNKPRKEHVLGLLLTLKAIAKDEAAFLARVTVQVDVNLKLAQQMLLKYRFLCFKDRRLLLRTRIEVESVQIVVVGVQAVVAARDSIRIYKWNDLEDVLLQQ